MPVHNTKRACIILYYTLSNRFSQLKIIQQMVDFCVYIIVTNNRPFEELIMYKEQILELHKQGKSRKEIREMLGCSKSLVIYHVGDGQKEKHKKRCFKHRTSAHPYYRKIERFINKKSDGLTTINPKTDWKELMRGRVKNFMKRNNIMSDKFTVEDVINKFGENPKCYLTGQDINIYETRTYEFDHILPASRGGDNSLDNLGICTKEANQAKRALTKDEFYKLCKSVVEQYESELTTQE